MPDSRSGLMSEQGRGMRFPGRRKKSPPGCQTPGKASTIGADETAASQSFHSANTSREGGPEGRQPNRVNRNLRRQEAPYSDPLYTLPVTPVPASNQNHTLQK